MGRRQTTTRSRKNYFVPVDSDSFRRKRSRGWTSKSRPWNPIAFLLRPFARLFRKTKQATDDSASPDTTALMSFEELSSYSTTTESQRGALMDAVMEKFPSWHSFSIVDTEPVPPPQPLPAKMVVQPAEQVVDKPRGRLTRTLQRFRPASDTATTDDDSQHFSISTDVRQASTRNINITISNSFNSYIPPEQWHDPGEGRVSLEQFMADSVKNLASIIVPLGEAGSVESALLGVSYDEDYPQLVLQASSLDGGSRLTQAPAASTTTNDNLGAHYGHPAADTPTWLDRSLEEMWGTQLADDDTSSSASSASFDAPMTMSEWMDEAVAEFSITDSVKSLSEMLEKDVVQPVMEFCQPKPKKRRILFRILKPKA